VSDDVVIEVFGQPVVNHPRMLALDAKLNEPPVDEVTDLCTPDTLYVTCVAEDAYVVRGGPDGQTIVAVFASPLAAEHFVRYCVEFDKTFAGVRP
jgi:hypothetical protein